MNDVIKDFHQIKEEATDNDVAAAMLVLASRLSGLPSFLSCDNLSHQICLGIRMGLFGVGASDHTDIRSDFNIDTGLEVEHNLERIADAIEALTADSE